LLRSVPDNRLHFYLELATSQNVVFYIHAAFAMPFLLRQQTFRPAAFCLSVPVFWSMFRQWFLCLVPMYCAVMSVN
ncbi:hypothetical protein, partial [uncultured Prevotella sp.]|uniref:hypothetical protein n=1 Tax=uncultured Prevotella sp. TaxID=159272 RepID=UPI00265D0EDD